MVFYVVYFCRFSIKKNTFLWYGSPWWSAVQVIYVQVKYVQVIHARNVAIFDMHLLSFFPHMLRREEGHVEHGPFFKKICKSEIYTGVFVREHTIIWNKWIFKENNNGMDVISKYQSQTKSIGKFFKNCTWNLLIFWID